MKGIVMTNRLNDHKWDATQHYKNIKVAKEYDRIRFSSLAGRVFNNQEKRIIRECFDDLPRDNFILDMPCGTGRLAEPLLEAGWKVYGVDISAEMLRVASERLAAYGDRFVTEVMDAFNMIGSDKQFEAALCARVLMHFPLQTQIKFLQGVGSITRRRIVINHSLNSPYQRFRRWIKKLLGHQQSAGYPITNGEIKQLLAAAGFTEVKRKRINPLISEAIYIVAERTD
jgi:SAM-dependent methyltransferase